MLECPPCLPSRSPPSDPSLTAPAVQLCDAAMSYPVAKAFWFVPGLSDRQASTAALRGVNLSVERGERMAVFGENGAGKSTLLRLIAGLLIPSNGRVLVAGVDASCRASRLARRVGYVLGEERSFYWRLSGLENMRFFAALEQRFGSAANQEIERLLHGVGLAERASRPVAEYSAGMRQRLALARGLLGDPEILLLDEPTRSLDPAGTDVIHELLSGALARQRTLLVATNRFEDAANLCTRISVLREGRIAANEELPESASLETLTRFVRTHLTAKQAVG